MMKKVLIYLLCSTVLVFLLAGCGNSSNDDSGKKSANKGSDFDTEKIEKNITISEIEEAKDGSLVAIVKNDNDEVVEIEIEVVFYDSEENSLGSDTCYLSMYNKQEMACEFYDTPSDYNDYEVNVVAEENYYPNYFNQIEVTDNDTGEQVVVQVTNNADEEIEVIDVAVVFYKDGKIVGYSGSYESNLRSGSKSTSNIYYPYDENYNDVSFDDYKVFVSAYGY